MSVLYLDVNCDALHMSERERGGEMSPITKNAYLFMSATMIYAILIEAPLIPFYVASLLSFNWKIHLPHQRTVPKHPKFIILRQRSFIRNFFTATHITLYHSTLSQTRSLSTKPQFFFSSENFNATNSCANFEL